MKWNLYTFAEALAPFVLVPIFFSIAVMSYKCTVSVMILIGAICVHEIFKPKLSEKSPFFLSWTIASFTMCLLVFDFHEMDSVFITVRQKIYILILTAITFYSFGKIKLLADELFLPHDDEIVGSTRNFQYCSLCRANYNDRLFHTRLWDCCILKDSFPYFVLGHIAGLTLWLYCVDTTMFVICGFGLRKELLFSGKLQHCNSPYINKSNYISTVLCAYSALYCFLLMVSLLFYLFIGLRHYFAPKKAVNVSTDEIY